MSKHVNAHLVIIDPQNDFMDLPGSALPVRGASEDMQRMATLIGRVGPKLADVHVTLDSHHPIDVAHPALWVDEAGEHPAPFTIISHDDVKNRVWNPRGGLRQRMLDYTRSLADHGRFDLMIWPVHCTIGSPGHNVYAPLKTALDAWEERRFATVDYVTKGTNAFTEHYGAIAAEVVDDDDPSTQLNTRFLRVLQDADVVAIGGEASSHCVKTTVEQIVENIGDAHLQKLVLLTDCMSPVDPARDAKGNVVVDFPGIARTFLEDMRARGLQLGTSDRWLA